MLVSTTLLSSPQRGVGSQNTLPPPLINPVSDVVINRFLNLLSNPDLNDALKYLKTSDPVVIVGLANAASNAGVDIEKISKVFRDSTDVNVKTFTSHLHVPGYTLFGDHPLCTILSDYQRRPEEKPLVEEIPARAPVALVDAQPPPAVEATPLTEEEVSHQNYVNLCDTVFDLKSTEVVGFNLNKDLQAQLTKISSLEERSQVYRKLIERCIAELQPKKGKPMNMTSLKLSKEILERHQQLVKDEVLDKKDELLLRSFFPLVEACVNSSNAAFCSVGLRMLTLVFSFPKPSVDGKEVKLLENFLLLSPYLKNPELKTVCDELLNVVLSLKERLHINYFKAVQSKYVDKDLSLAFLLICLEKMKRSDDKYRESAQDKECLALLAKRVADCSESSFIKILGFFDAFSVEKMRSLCAINSFKDLFRVLFLRKVDLARNVPEKPAEALNFFCTHIDIAPVQTDQQLEDVFSELLGLIKRSPKTSSDVILKALDLLLKQGIKQREFSGSSGKVKSKKDKNDVNVEMASTQTTTSMKHLFSAILDVLPSDKKSKRRVLESLAEVYSHAKKNFNRPVDVDRFLFCYVTDHDPDHDFSEDTIQMALDVLESNAQATFGFNQLAKGWIPSKFIKQCIEHGMTRYLVSEDSPQRCALLERLCELMEALFKSNESPESKRESFHLLLSTLTYSATDKHTALKTLSRLFNQNKGCYDDNPEMYWNHFYRFGIFSDPAGLKGDEPEEMMVMRRQGIESNIEGLLGQKTWNAVIHALNILYNRNVKEFKGHLPELVGLYKRVFASLLLLEPETGLNIMNKWIGEELGNKTENASIFLKYHEEAKESKFQTRNDQVAFCELMETIISTYQKICSKMIEIKPEDKKVVSIQFLAGFGMIHLMGSLNIETFADLQSLERILNEIMDFIDKQKVAHSLDRTVATLIKATSAIFTHSKYKGVELEATAYRIFSRLNKILA